MKRALVVAMLLLATPAAADPTPAEKETARELFRQGNEARSAGDFDTALARYSAAHALAATPITALEASRAHAQLGHLVQARDLALSVARMPAARAESDRAREARAAAAQVAASLYERIATLTIDVDAPRPPSLAIDGVAIRTEGPQRLDPGPHRLTGRIEDGPISVVDVTLADGETARVRLVVAASPAPPSPPTSITPALPVRPRPSRALFYGGIAGAVAFGIAGAVTGALAAGKAATSDCDGTRCTKAGIADVSTGRTYATVATITFGLALVCAGVGVWGLVRDRHARSVSRFAGDAWRF